MSKAGLREQMGLELRRLRAAERGPADAAIGQRLGLLPALAACRVLAAFWPLGSEPDIRPLLTVWLATGKLLLLPRWLGAAAGYRMVQAAGVSATGPHGAAEPDAGAAPATAAQLAAAVWLVPGVAFDDRGGRLGRGGGWYDRLLQEQGGPFVGVAYHCQRVGQVPMEPHDIRMHWLVTDRETIRCVTDISSPAGIHIAKKESGPWNGYMAYWRRPSDMESVTFCSGRWQPGH